MKNFQVDIFNLENKELLATYTKESDNNVIATREVIKKFRSDYPQLKDTRINTLTRPSKRNIVPVQEPANWEFI